MLGITFCILAYQANIFIFLFYSVILFEFNIVRFIMIHDIMLKFTFVLFKENMNKYEFYKDIFKK